MFDRSVDMSTPTAGRTHVTFFHKPVQNKRESKKAGKPVFVETLCVRILVPGGKNMVERIAEESDKEKFAEQYRRFINNEEQIVEGTPIEELAPLIGATAVANLRADKILTIEALADCPENRLPERGGHGYQQSARSFLEVRDGSGADKITSLKNELEERDKRIAALEEELEYFQRRIKEIEGGTDTAPVGGHSGDGGGADSSSNNRRKHQSGRKAVTEGSQ